MHGWLREAPLPPRTRRVARDPIPYCFQRPASNGVLPRPRGSKDLLGEALVRVPPVHGSRVGDVPCQNAIRRAEGVGPEDRFPHDERADRRARTDLEDRGYRGSPPQARPSGRGQHHEDPRAIAALKESRSAGRVFRSSRVSLGGSPPSRPDRRSSCDLAHDSVARARSSAKATREHRSLDTCSDPFSPASIEHSSARGSRAPPRSATRPCREPRCR